MNSQSQPTCRVRLVSGVRINGDAVAPGTEVDLADDLAANLVHRGKAVLAEDPRIAAVVESEVISVATHQVSPPFSDPAPQSDQEEPPHAE